MLTSAKLRKPWHRKVYFLCTYVPTIINKAHAWLSDPTEFTKVWVQLKNVFLLLSYNLDLNQARKEK